MRCAYLRARADTTSINKALHPEPARSEAPLITWSCNDSCLQCSTALQRCMEQTLEQAALWGHDISHTLSSFIFPKHNRISPTKPHPLIYIYIYIILILLTTHTLNECYYMDIIGEPRTNYQAPWDVVPHTASQYDLLTKMCFFSISVFMLVLNSSLQNCLKWKVLNYVPPN